MADNPGICIYIDEANLRMGARECGFEIDYIKFHQWLKRKYKAAKIYLFLPYFGNRSEEYEKLRAQGYILVFKKARRIQGILKANCDVDLTLAITSDFYEKRYTSCVLITGDGDFRILIDFLSARSVISALMIPDSSNQSHLFKDLRISQVPLDAHYRKFCIENEKGPHERTAVS